MRVLALLLAALPAAAAAQTKSAPALAIRGGVTGVPGLSLPAASASALRPAAFAGAPALAPGLPLLPAPAPGLAPAASVEGAPASQAPELAPAPAWQGELGARVLTASGVKAAAKAAGLDESAAA